MYTEKQWVFMFYIYLHSLTPAGQSQKLKILDYTTVFFLTPLP